jgi:hypothetical protein
MQAEVERHRQEASRELAAAQAELAQKSAESLRSTTEVLRLTSEQAAWLRKREELEAELQAARKASERPRDTAELTSLREENKQLEAWLAEAEERVKHAGSSDGGGGGQEMDDLRRRFELAVQDVRELKTKNAEMSEQLAKLRERGGGAAAGGAGENDWESLKKRMMAQLESDFDENDESQKADRLTVQGAIKITDQVVADKERELEELRQMLTSQSQQVGEMAVGAAAVAQMLDMDELVLQERETLKRLQETLREQSRKAEIDISLERAKLARERAEVEEKVRALASEKASAPQAGAPEPEKGKKPAGRKWLDRLGLGEGKAE